MTLVSSERLYTGKVINLDRDSVQFPNGSTGQLEMVRHPGASAVVPFLDDPRGPDPRINLIRQFRHAADTFIWEIPAGRLDPGETPATCAQRELEEEIGMTADVLARLTTIYTTPGFTNEKIHLFMATELKKGTHKREADEFLEVHIRRWSEVMDMIRTGQIVDGKTLVAILFVQSFRR
ncbi:MAG TPA: NUDIX hydrolase [Gemmatimonadales bacterium]|jgi:ADP-ribose pyrophosphatase|nr:NUDIX hydrolase [Gemmatimonadales bacterium]